jgi:hypothetical protein
MDWWRRRLFSLHGLLAVLLAPAVDAAYQRQAISQHGAELDAIKAGFARQAATASAILAQP